MKKTLILSAAGLCACTTFAGLYGDTPDAKHAWAVHDWNRPKPVKVTAEPGLPPSDAIVLFDGTAESLQKNWCDKNGAPTLWKLGTEGDFYCVPKWKNGGDIFTRQSFGDCQLHLEYRHDKDVGDGNPHPQMRGNSGVFIMGNYEIQVLESYFTSREMEGKPGFVDNYTDGQAGSVYAENPPLVNPQRKVGEWQVYDIIFHQPVWEGQTLVHPGSVTVLFNGVLVQDHWEMEGLTTHCRRRPLAPHPTKGQLHFQDHGCTVHFRNIWIREIPSRWDNTTHSTLSAKEADVKKLRAETAAKLFAKIDAQKADAPTLCALLEVISYYKEKPYTDALKNVCSQYKTRVEAMDDAALDKAKGELSSVKNALAVLRRNSVIGADCPMCKLLDSIWARKGWNKKK